MEELVIIGARPMGRETCSYAREMGMQVKGFLDSDPSVLSGYDGYPPVLGPVETYVPGTNDVFVCALGDPAWKMKYVEMIAAKGGRFVNVIHPSAYVGQNVRLGVGCIICPHVSITNDTVLGDHVIVNVNASLSHDGRYGTGTTICPGCHVAGYCSFGERVFLGIGASVVPHVNLGDDVFVAAGACVTKSFERGRVMGVPAALK